MPPPPQTSNRTQPDGPARSPALKRATNRRIGSPPPAAGRLSPRKLVTSSTRAPGGRPRVSGSGRALLKTDHRCCRHSFARFPAPWSRGGGWSCRFAMQGNGHHWKREPAQPLPPGSKHWATVCLPGCPLRRRLPFSRRHGFQRSQARSVGFTVRPSCRGRPRVVVARRGVVPAVPRGHLGANSPRKSVPRAGGVRWRGLGVAGAAQEHPRRAGAPLRRPALARRGEACETERLSPSPVRRGGR
jgi:hypothetical protein